MSSTYFHLEFLGNNNFLTDNPEITFFKFVYKRFSNFSMEFFEENLLGEHNFGNILTCKLSKNGDLINQIFLKIELPRVAILSNNLEIFHFDKNKLEEIESNNIKYKNIYETVNDYINFFNFNILNELKKNLLLDNISKVLITNIIDSKLYFEYISKLNNLTIKFNNIVYLPLNPNFSGNNIITSSINLGYYLDFYKYLNYYAKTEPISSSIIINLLNKYISLLLIIKKQIFILLEENQSLILNINRKFINFSWVNKIGHQIIDNIELYIGGQLIDSIDSIKTDIDYQLNVNYYKDEIYNKLIGNIRELTEFNSNIKPSYTLYIPINFWFAKYTNSILPIIHLKNNDVTIIIKLNELYNCCYFERINNFNLEEYIKIQENITLLVNYIFLDQEEKEKFENISEEYLIHQMQKQIFEITSINMNLNLTFFNSVIQLFWVIRNNDNIYRLLNFEYSCNFYADIIELKQDNNNLLIITDNFNLINNLDVNDNIEIINSVYYSGRYKILKIVDNKIVINRKYYIDENYLFNYYFRNNKYHKKLNYIGANQSFIKKINNLNTFKTASVQLNNENLFEKRDSLYFNFVLPYQYFNKSPEYGLNCIIFNLNSNELYQPNGFCNIINFKSFLLNINNINNINATINIYAVNYNFLKFNQGTAELIFTI